MSKLLLILSLFLVIGCKTKKGIGGDTNACNTTATVKDFTGLDGCKFLFVLDNGEKWLPTQINDENFVLQDGQKIKFGYKEAESMVSICMAESKSIIVTCIEETAPGNSSSEGIPPKPQKEPCIETTNPSEVAWMAALVKEHNPYSIVRYNYLDGYAYYYMHPVRSRLYDCQGNFLCDIPGKIMNDCVRRMQNLEGKLVIWEKN